MVFRQRPEIVFEVAQDHHAQGDRAKTESRLLSDLLHKVVCAQRYLKIKNSKNFLIFISEAVAELHVDLRL